MYDESQLDAEILAAVQKVWEDDGTPLLLSRLGLAHLTDSAKNFVSEHGISLKRHARLRLTHALRFVPMPRQGGGLAPLAETVGMTDAELEQTYRLAAASAPDRPRRRRFERYVWCAFRDPLPEGGRRAIDPSVAPPTVRELGSEENLRPGELLVEAHETAIGDAPDVQPSAAAVERAILSWCAEKGVDPDRLAAWEVRPAANIVGRERNARNGDVGSRSVDAISFVEVLKSIPPEHLARVSVPGDVLLLILERLGKR